MVKFLRTILILLFTTLLFDGYSQHYLGVSGGFGRGGIRLFPQKESGGLWGLPSGGLTYKYYGGMKYVGGIGSDLIFMQQGFSEEIPDFSISDTTRSFNRKVNSLMLPIFWQPHINLFKGNMRIFINLGVAFSYNISSTFEVESEQNGFIASGQYQMLLVRDNRWGYGLCGGAGFNVVMGRFELGAEGRYYYGYSDLLRNRNKYETNPLRSPLDNINISMSLYYRLGSDFNSKRVKKIKHFKEDGNNKTTKGI